MLSLSLGINSLAGRGGISTPQIITASVSPAIQSVEDGDTWADLLLASATTASNYDSTASGNDPTPVAEIRIDGGAWTALSGNTTTALAADEVAEARVTVTDDQDPANVRVFSAGSTTVAATVPAQMSAPTLTVDSASEITATLAADPDDGGSEILEYDLRYSTDEATWTEILDIESPWQIGGLTASTLYYVQTRAINAVGAGAWSASDSDTTGAATAVLSAATAVESSGNIDWTVTSDTASGTIYAAARISTNPQLSATNIINGTGDALYTNTDATPTADAANAGTFTAPDPGTYLVDVVQVTAAGNSNIVTSETAVIIADPALTLTSWNETTDAAILDIVGDLGGTLKYAFVTEAVTLNATTLETGTDGDIVASGTVGEFTAGGPALEATNLSGGTPGTAYNLHFWVEFSDASLSNVIVQAMTVNSVSSFSVTQTAYLSFDKGTRNGDQIVFSDVDLGTGANPVYVLLTALSGSDADDLTPATFTVGGATGDIEAGNPTDPMVGVPKTAFTQIRSFSAPGTTTGDIAINVAGSFRAAVIEVHEVAGAEVVDTAQDFEPDLLTSAVVTLDMDVVDGDVVLAMAAAQNMASTRTWTGATKTGTDKEPWTDRWVTVAKHTASGTETPRAIDCTFGAQSRHSGAGIVLRATAAPSGGDAFLIEGTTDALLIEGTTDKLLLEA